MKIEKTSTGLIIHDPTDDMKRKILRYFSLRDPEREFFIYSGNDRNRLPVFGKDHDVIYITSGLLKVKDPMLQQMTKHYTTLSIPTPESVDIEMSRSPRSKIQEDCIANMITKTKESRKLTIELKGGVGKLEPYSSRIPTPTKRGFTRMGDLKVGDYVFDRTGRPTKILDIFEQGVTDIYKVTFSDGRSVLCGKEHLWTVKTDKHETWETVETQDMLNDYKQLSDYKSLKGIQEWEYKYYIPYCKPVQYPHKDVPMDPWVLGCFISSMSYDSHHLTLTCKDQDIPERIAEICGFRYKQLQDGITYIFKDKKTNKLIKTKDFFKDIPSMNRNDSTDICIPNEYMYNEPSIRIKLLQGIFDVNGIIEPCGGRFRVIYQSPSIKLLKQIQRLIFSFGYSANIINDKHEWKYKTGFYGKLVLNVPHIFKPHLFTVQSKHDIAVRASKSPKNKYRPKMYITDIHKVGRDNARCILVDNDEHLYLTNEYIVTHNTFIALYAISKLHLKPLIIAPTSLLKNQWIDNFVDCGIDKRDIATNIHDGKNKKITVVTIAAIGNELREDWKGLIKSINDARYGIKVIDEAHLALKSVMRFDAICNIKHNWYLSATLGRSDPEEDQIINLLFADAERFVGDARYEEYQHQYINIYLQDVYYYPSYNLCSKTFKFGKKGLIKSTYYNMLMQYKDGIPFINNLITLMKIARKVETYDGKILVLVPLLDIIDTIIDRMQKDPFFSKYSIAKINGLMPMRERQRAMESDYILSTSQSVGTGVDIQNLGCVINYDQAASPIITEQIVVRLRDRGKECWYFDVCDHVRYARSIENWGRRRRTDVIGYIPGVNPEFKKLPDIHC